MLLMVLCLLQVMSSNNNISHLTMGTVGLTNKDPSHNRSGIDEDAEEVKDFRYCSRCLPTRNRSFASLTGD